MCRNNNNQENWSRNVILENCDYYMGTKKGHLWTQFYIPLNFAGFLSH